MTREELLARADELAQGAKSGSRGSNYATNTPGNIAKTRVAVVDELEALRLTLLALFGPVAEWGEKLLAFVADDDQGA